MLAAVGGLTYVASTVLKLESSAGYVLPLPVVIAAARGGGAAGWRTVMATAFLLMGARVRRAAPRRAAARRAPPRRSVSPGVLFSGPRSPPPRRRAQCCWARCAR